MTIILYIHIVSQRHCLSTHTFNLLTTIPPYCFIRTTNNYHSLLLLLVLLLICWNHQKNHHNIILYLWRSISSYLIHDVLALVISHRLSLRTEYSCSLFQRIYRIITNLTLGSNHCFHYFCIVSSSFHDTYLVENLYHFSLKSLPFLQAGIIKFQLDKEKGKHKNICIVSRTSVSVIVCTNQIYYNQGDFTQHNIIITYLVLGYFNRIV